MTAHLLTKDQEKSIENKNTLRKKIPCNQCEKTFVNSGDLNNHIKTSHFKNDHESNEANNLQINAKMFPCDQYQVKFLNPDNLNNHKRTHHLKNQDTVYFNEAFTENKSQEIPILFCDLCNYRTRSNTTLKRNYELNHNCDKCDKTFTSKRGLNIHRSKCKKHKPSISSFSRKNCQTDQKIDPSVSSQTNPVKAGIKNHLGGNFI